jgi:hypothetical protein
METLQELNRLRRRLEREGEELYPLVDALEE